jgi:hypothetical protein
VVASIAFEKLHPDVKRVIAPKALDRFKQRIREITRPAKDVSLETTMEELARICGLAIVVVVKWRLWKLTV